MTRATLLVAVVIAEQMRKSWIRLAELDQHDDFAVQVVVHCGLDWRGSGVGGGYTGLDCGGFQSGGNVDAPHFQPQRWESGDFGHDEILNLNQMLSFAVAEGNKHWRCCSS